jgi:S-DNA-T family DNA segregation ATPase FtsK/SpoIIIE
MSLDHDAQFPPDWDDSKVIPGELHVPDDLSEEDIPPGIVATYEPRTRVLTKAGGAALVAAGAAGRGAGAGARGLGVLARWFGAGTRGVSYLGYRYVRAHDLQEALGGVQKKSDWQKVEIVRRARWKLLARITGGVGALNFAEWLAFVWPADMDPFGWAAVIPPTSTGILAGAAVTAYGRYRLNRPELAPGEYVAEQDDPDSDEPFPLAVCQTGEQVAECVSRALAWEGIGTRSVQVLGHRGWGWEVDVLLKGANADKVNAVAKDLDGHFNIKKGGALIEGDASNAAHIILRLVTANPFENMPRPTVHAPNSLDIADPHQLALCMDGSWFAPVLEGSRTIVVGVSGSAKSTGVLRDLAEVVTACHNAIAIEMDPVKDGLREFEGVMAVPPIRGNDDCELWLSYLVRMAEARNLVRNKLKMGDTWIATRERPAIFVFADEFIYLSTLAKKLFIQLNRLGKQSGIYLVAAGQDATSDSLGDAIADSFNLSIMLAARHADIPLVLGSGAIGEGYRPDRLQPAQNKDITNDAGQSYIKGAGVSRPLVYGWIQRSRASIDAAVDERKAAGRPWFDHDTLAAADLLHVIRRDGAKAQLTLADRLEALDEQGGVDDARKVAVLLRAFGDKEFLPTTEEILPALADAGVDTDATALAQLLRKHAPNVGASRQEWDGKAQVRGWSRGAVEQAAAGLLDPSMARLRAA